MHLAVMVVTFAFPSDVFIHVLGLASTVLYLLYRNICTHVQSKGFYYSVVYDGRTLKPPKCSQVGRLLEEL